MLQAVTLPVAAVTAEQREQMYRLMDAHYEAVDRGRFVGDLLEKDAVILLRGADGAIQGFTTFLRYGPAHPWTGGPVRVLYSGDTIIDRRHWGSQALAFEWLYQAGREQARHRDAPLVWFLISKGPRTYRYLSAFSRSYWPHHAVPTPPAVQALMQALATDRFGADYSPTTGVVHFPASRGHLRPQLAELSPAERRRPEVAFFLRMNPGYLGGDELVCLTELTPTNLKPLSRRVFERGLRDGLARCDAPCLETSA
jgi:hypothetical protein